MKLGIDEILSQANKLKAKDKRLEFLRKHVSGTLIDVMRLGLQKADFTWILTKAKYEYNPSGYVDQQGVLFQSLRKIPRYFLEGNELPHITDEKRDLLWVQFLEALDTGDAKLMESIRQGVWPYRNINESIMKEAFPEVFGAVLPAEE